MIKIYKKEKTYRKLPPDFCCIPPPKPNALVIKGKAADNPKLANIAAMFDKIYFKSDYYLLIRPPSFLKTVRFKTWLAPSPRIAGAAI